jgi:type 2 lantibiotic biosynthesis protein LanM
MNCPAFTETDLRDMAGRASTLDERRAGQVVVDGPTSAADVDRLHALFAEWGHAATAGDEALFAEKLRLDGDDGPAALRRLGHARLYPGQPLPQWARTFQSVMAGADETALPPRNESGENTPAPFEELIWPIVESARAILGERVGNENPNLISASAWINLERSLLARLATLCSPGLYGDFVLYRHLARHQRGRPVLPFSQPGSRILYDAYVHAWHAGRRNEFFLARPVAARLIGTAVTHWIDSTVELMERLARDLSIIADTFASGVDPGMVNTIKTDLSDLHAGGRTVSILTFAGLRVVYKPKDLRVDTAWSRLLNWLNEKGCPVGFRPVKCLALDGYGWAEFVAADENPRLATDLRNGAAFYRRAGALLALLHLLRGADFHQENVISCDDFPVPIDLETLLRPNIAKRVEDSAASATEPAQSLLNDSVLATFYLPTWAWGRGGGLVPIGGLDDPIDPGLLWIEFHRTNTDDMAISKQVRGQHSDAVLGGASRLADFFDDFMRGFNELYEFLVSHRAALLAADGPLIGFHGIVVRVVLVDTRAYSLVQRRARAYASLVDGAAWSLHFDLLLRGDVGRHPTPQTWAIRAAEREAMASCDVPMFVARTDRTWLDTRSGVRIESCLEAPPFEELLSQVNRLSDEDRVFQTRFIESTISRTRPTRQEVSTRGGRSPNLVSEAVRLGQILCESAIWRGNRVAWYGLNPIDHDHIQVSVIPSDLYAGMTGMALFLAALSRQTGEARFREAALAAAESAREALTSSLRIHVARSLGLGGAFGLGSIIYGLVRVATSLHEDRLLEDACSVAQLVDSELISADRGLDVVKGAAGAILGLLALYRATGNEEALESAVTCGRHLLASRTIDEFGNQGWATIGGHGHHLTGFSHGAAGIALALLRLYRVTGDTEIRSAAEDALAYERRVFQPRRNNWPDFRSDPPSKHEGIGIGCQWCHGAPGIGLARLGCMDIIDDGEMRTEIEAAVLCTLGAPTLSTDHLCCGNFGRIEFLYTAGVRLQRPELISVARERTNALIETAGKRGKYLWQSGDDQLNPSLFTGIAGIGYQLLRFEAPAEFPSLLLWAS